MAFPSSPSPKHTVLSLRLSGHEIRALDALVEQTGTNRSAVLRNALEAYAPASTPASAPSKKARKSKKGNKNRG